MPSPEHLLNLSAKSSNPKGATEALRLFGRDWPSDSWRDLHVAVALSGGVDSMALLRLVLTEKENSGGTGSVIALHVNHQLRGADAEADAEWCREQCKTLGAQLVVLECNAAERAAEDGDGLEAAARSQRYELLIQAAEQAGARYLAVAHTRDDQVETVLFRLLRGSGLRGLRGIPKLRQLTSAITIVRPLLACSREMLEGYLKDLGQSSRMDGSNRDSQFTRNRLRHELLPKLREEYNSNLDAALVQLAAQADEAEQLVERQARRLLEQASVTLQSGKSESASQQSGSENQLSLLFGSISPWESEEIPLLISTAIRLAWREAKLPEQDMTYSWWRLLATLLQEEKPSRVLNLPGEVRASVQQGQLVLQWPVRQS